MKNVFKPAKAKPKRLKISLFGESGVGKTFFSLGFPRPAVIDLEGGTDHYADRFDFSVLDTKSFAEVMTAVTFLGNGKHTFQTLVIDPVTVVWSALQDGRMEFKVRDIDKAIAGEEVGTFSAFDWNVMKRFYSMLMTKLLNLPLHVVLTGRQKDDYEVKANGEMVKVGVKLDAERSTPYLTDIRFKLIVEGKKRLAIIEKDRTGLYDTGSVIENPCFDSFKAAINGKGKKVVTHQREEEALENDSLFFAEKEANQNGRLSHHSLLVQLAKMGLGEMVAEYKSYVLEKYDLDDLDELETSDIREQMLLLRQCVDGEKKMQKFIEVLRGHEE
jgi:hypothetical protein